MAMHHAVNNEFGNPGITVCANNRVCVHARGSSSPSYMLTPRIFDLKDSIVMLNRGSLCRYSLEVTDTRRN